MLAIETLTYIENAAIGGENAPPSVVLMLLADIRELSLALKEKKDKK
jgi:hypothetical protein